MLSGGSHGVPILGYMAFGPDLILANRSFVDHNSPPRQGQQPVPGAGGLVAALQGVIQPWNGRSGTTWIGAGLGAFDRTQTDAEGYELIPFARGELRHRRLFFDERDWRDHYEAVSNSFLWPLLHLSHLPLPELAASYPVPAAPGHDQWIAFRRVNEAFAAAATAEGGVSCWVHDYQLALVPALLRARRFAGKIGFFLHTPFPDFRVAGRFLTAANTMYVREWLEGVLGADLVGLQTADNLARFEHAAVSLCGFERVPGGLARGGRIVRASAIPVGVASGEVEQVLPADVSEYRDFAQGLPLVVGLERSDYTKGIPERLGAIATAYRAGHRFAYLGLAAPTRESVPAYAALKGAVQAAASEAQASAKDLPFVQRFESTPWPKVIALLSAADVIFTSSLADGMNLVPLQGAIAQSGRPESERGIILTGRHAGVAAAHCANGDDGLLAIDPFDIDRTAATLGAAIQRQLPPITNRLIDRVRTHDARAWADAFLAELENS